MYLTQGLHRALQRHPHKLALRDLADDAGAGLDTATLVQQVAQGAAALQSLGVAAGDRVALLSPNHPQLVQQLLACWWLGAVACPLNPRWSQPELHAAMADCHASLLVVAPHLTGLSSAAGLATALKAGGCELDGDRLAGLAAARLPLADSRTGGQALAAILYTAGTTGRCKGVMLSHANFWAAAIARSAELHHPADAVALLVAPLCQVAGLGRLIAQLIVGGTCLTLPDWRTDAVMAAVARHPVTDILLLPSMLQALLDHPGFDAGPLQGLRRIVFGAAPMPPALLARALAAWPQAEFAQAYGLTETAATVCINLPALHRPALKADATADAIADATADATADAAADAAARSRQHAAGRAGLGAELRIVDDQGADSPVGQVGQILVRGPMVMLGYWQQPEATAAVLQDGWLHTGDLGRIDDAGYLFILDRQHDVIVSGGESIYCTEVEAVMRLHPAVADVAVLGLPHAVWGEAVHAVVVLVQGAPPQPDALRRFCRKHLAGYKCPRSVSFAAGLPLTAAGKVRKSRLRESLAQTPPSATQGATP